MWHSLGEFLQQPEALRVEITTYAEDRRSSARGEESEAKRLVERHRQLERQRIRLVDAYPAGVLDVSELRQRGERLEVEQGEIHRRQEELQALKASQVRVEEIYQEVEAFCARLREGLDRLTFEERQKVVRWLVERVVGKGGEVTVEHVIPLQGRYRPDKKAHGTSREAMPTRPKREVPKTSRGAEVASSSESHFGGMWLANRADVQGAEEPVCARCVPHDEREHRRGADLGGAAHARRQSSALQPRAGARPTRALASLHADDVVDRVP